MKLENNYRRFRRKCGAFLLLPSLEVSKEMPIKSTGLKLFTKTWPPKKGTKKPDQNQNDTDRPLTATLDKPTVLDISLIGQIDMSTVRKEFLNISNLCRMPILLKNRKLKPPSKIVRPLSLPPPERQNKPRKKKVESSAEDSWEDTDEASIRSARKIKKIENISAKPTNKIKTSNIAVINNNNVKSLNGDANNNNSNQSISKTGGLKINKNVLSLRGGGKLLLRKNNNVNSVSVGEKSTKLPEPCTTCGRPDQPERFHSHPVTPLKNPKKIMEEEPPKNPPVKSTVQKPVAIKYKSKVNSNNNRPTPVRKSSLPAQKLVHTPPNLGGPSSAEEAQTNPPAARPKSTKRTLTCYICGREFGTASLPLHEPKCLQKWERENANLPEDMQRKPPIKPDMNVSQDEYNRLCFESAQSLLTPCKNCGRTFYPDRLIVHQRSCKTTPQNLKTTPQTSNTSVNSSISSSPLVPVSSPPTVECYVCGRMFGTHSIKIHEKQCLKKWNLENESLPMDMQSPQPSRKKGESASTSQDNRPGSGRKSPLFPCYICGKLFTVNSIYIHEPQCLKMWKVENDKLPASKRRPQPLKPDIKFTRDGKLDIEATNDANWQSHLSQLVACKFCSRTFNPERVEVHERSCKGG